MLRPVTVIHSLLNCLRYGRGNDPSAHLGGGRGLISDADALAFLDRGEYGYLTDKGLIPLGDEERKAIRDAALALTPLMLP